MVLTRPLRQNGTVARRYRVRKGPSTMVKLPYVLVLVAILGHPCSSVLQAQSSKGGIDGSAEDSSHGALPGARVTLVPGDKNGVTDAQGTFRITDLTPGDYTILVSYVGFSPFTAAVTVKGGDVTKVTATLEVASIADQVLVTAE